MKTTFLAISALMISSSAFAGTGLGFTAELQCSIFEKGTKNGSYQAAELTSKREGFLFARVVKELTLQNGKTYSVAIASQGESLTTNTNEVTFNQSLKITENGGSFTTTAISGPTMFRMESFADIMLGYFMNRPSALCNMFSCPSIQGDFGVPGDASIGVVCQVRGKDE